MVVHGLQLRYVTWWLLHHLRGKLTSSCDQLQPSVKMARLWWPPFRDEGLLAETSRRMLAEGDLTLPFLITGNSIRPRTLFVRLLVESFLTHFLGGAFAREATQQCLSFYLYITTYMYTVNSCKFLI